jgi:uncharacterized surface protein with fasciclin (FAS1) repeats
VQGHLQFLHPLIQLLENWLRGYFQGLLKPENKVQLTDLLNHHVVHGKRNFKDLKDGQKLKTINGKELNVTVKDNAVSINGANIRAKDMEGRNGVVHSLDAVIE